MMKVSETLRNGYGNSIVSSSSTCCGTEANIIGATVCSSVAEPTCVSPNIRMFKIILAVRIEYKTCWTLMGWIETYNKGGSTLLTLIVSRTVIWFREHIEVWNRNISRRLPRKKLRTSWQMKSLPRCIVKNVQWAAGSGTHTSGRNKKECLEARSRGERAM